MNNRIVIYLGPTLPKKEAFKYLNAIYLPPAEQGDILSVIQQYNPSIIGLIDGVFYQARSVWHREIIYAIESGVIVYGASSMGALRAAELHQYGMVGVGDIFQLFSSGTLNDDDEVALLHADASLNYSSLSLPMVNITATLEALQLKKLISHSTMLEIKKISKGLYFPDRSLDNILTIYYNKNSNGNANNSTNPNIITDSDAAETHLSKYQLRSVFEKHYVDLKKQDAIELLQTIKKKSIDLNPANDKTKRNDSAFYNHERTVKNTKGSIKLGELSNYVAINLKDFRALNQQAMNRTIVRLYAETLGIKLERNEIERELWRFKQEKGITDDFMFKKWLQQNDLNELELEEIMEELAYSKRISNWIFYGLKAREKNTKSILNELKILGLYPKEKNRAIDYHNKVKESILEEKTKEKQISDYYVSYLLNSSSEVWTNWKIWMEESGLHDDTEVLHELIKYSRQNKESISNSKQLDKHKAWIKNNLQDNFSHVVIDLQHENRQLELQEIQNSIKMILQKSLRSFIFNQECNFYWMGIEDLELTWLTAVMYSFSNDYNIYSKAIKHNFALTINSLEKLQNTFSMLDYDNIYFELIIKLEELQNKTVIPLLKNKCIRKIWLVITNASLANASESLDISILEFHEVELTVCDQLLNFIHKSPDSVIEPIKKFFHQLFNYWITQKKPIRINNFERIANKILKMNNSVNENTNRTLIQFIKIHFNNIYFYSPNSWWLKDNHSSKVFLGNLSEINTLDEMHSKFIDTISKCHKSEKYCESQCHYYELCDSRHYILSKLRQFNSINCSETINCTVMQKVITDILINYFTKKQKTSDTTTIQDCYK